LTSVGIVARPGELGGAAMRDRVREFLRRRHPRARIVRSTGWVIPAPDFDGGAPPRLGGERFALVGDAAGLVDPLTGEGIYYAMASGELAGRLVAEGRAADYGRQVLESFGPELAAAGRHVRRYFRPAFLDALHFFARHHAGTRRVIGDLLSGRQGYRNLGRGAGGLQQLLGSILRRF
jgi:flavin-dependent dehydrogenase